jgi:hypothetical protein
MDFQQFSQLWKNTLSNDFIIIETKDFVRIRKKKKELKPVKDFVIVKDDDNIRYEAIRKAEMSKRVNHEKRTIWFR